MRARAVCRSDTWGRCPSSQVQPRQGAAGGVQPAGDGERRGVTRHDQPCDDEGQHRAGRRPRDDRRRLGKRSVAESGV